MTTIDETRVEDPAVSGMTAEELAALPLLVPVPLAAKALGISARLAQDLVAERIRRDEEGTPYDPSGGEVFPLRLHRLRSVRRVQKAALIAYIEDGVTQPGPHPNPH